MKTIASRTIVALFIGALLLGWAGQAFAVPVAPFSAVRREVVKDRVGNPHLFNSRAPLTRNGVRLLGAAVPTAGTVRLLAIPVAFQPDNSAATSGTGTFPYKTWGPASEPGYLTGRLTEVSNYFQTVSKGLVTIRWTLTRTITLPRTMAQYSADLNSPDPDVASSLMADVIAVGDSQINFAAADIIMLIHAGCGQEVTGLAGDIWSHHMSGITLPTQDNVDVSAWTVVPETECGDTFFKLANPTINVQAYEVDPTQFTNVFIPHYWDVLGTWCHELGHAFGMPDVYDVSYFEGLSLEYWSLMAAGNYLPQPDANEPSPWLIPFDANRPYFGSVPCLPDAWNLKLVGWSPVDNVIGTRIQEKIVPQSTPDGKIYRLWTNGAPASSEYFLMETRAHVGYDKYVPEEGLIIYHIDDNAGSLLLNDLQIDAVHPRIKPIPASGSLSIDPTIGNFFAGTGVAYPGMINNNHFGDNTDPNNVNYAGDATHIDVNKIRKVNRDIYADINTVQLQIIAPTENEVIYVTKPTLHAIAPGLDPNTVNIDVNGTGYIPDSYDSTTGELYVVIGPLSNGDYYATVSGELQGSGGIQASVTVNFTVSSKILLAGKQLITLPVVGVGNAAKVFGMDLADRIAWWDPDLRDYHRFPDPIVELTDPTNAVTDTLTAIKATPAGKAFWLNLPVTTALTLEGDVTQAGDPYAVDIFRGEGHMGDFVMIGSPYTYPISFNSLLIEYEGITYSISEAVAQKMIDPVLYWWEGNSYTLALLPNGLLRPWVGYWIYLRQGSPSNPMKLIYQPVPVTTRAASKAPRAAGTPSLWETTLKAFSPTAACSATVTVGVAPGATDQMDIGTDFFVPPTAPGGISLASDLGRSTQLIRDFRAAGSAATYSWDLTVSGPAGAQVVLTWPDLVRIPRDYSLVLHDAVTGEERYLRTSTSYVVKLGAQETSRNLTLTAAPKALAGLLIANVQAKRTRTNGTVTISCQVSVPASVSVEVRSANGRLIRRISAGRSQGAVALVWDGKDGQGRLVPAGAYQCQVMAVTANGQSAKAITLLPL